MRYFQNIRTLKLSLCRSGFTLLEMAIGLVAVGMMAAVVLQTTGGGDSSDAYTKTRAQLADMQAALDRFAAQNGYYPMPAPTNATSSSAQGIAVTSATASGILNVASGSILVGNFPYATVGMPAKYQSDHFKNGKDSAFRYAVSTQVTDTTNYKANSGQGVINVLIDKNGTASTTKAAYYIVSHGEIAGCSAPGGNQVVNCDISGNLFNLPFNKGTPGVNTGAAGSSNYFDDVMVYSDASNLDCSGLTARWDGSTNENVIDGPCQAEIGANEKLPVGSSVNKVNTSSTNSGSAVLTCRYNETTKRVELTAVGTCDCKPGQSSWLDASTGATCSSNTTKSLQSTPANSGAFSPVTDEKVTEGLVATDPQYGAATIRCVKGVLTAASTHAPSITAPFCVNNCGAQTITWTSTGIDSTGQSECTNTVPALLGAPSVDGQTDTATLDYANGAGSITVVCTNGELRQKPGTPATCNSLYPGTWKAGECSSTVCGSAGTVGAPVCQSSVGASLPDASCNPALKPESGQACTKPCDGCATPWGANLANGNSVTAYSATDCDKQTFTCLGNALQGSKTGNTVGTYTSSTVPASCLQNCATSTPKDVKVAYQLNNNTDLGTGRDLSGLNLSSLRLSGVRFQWNPSQPPNAVSRLSFLTTDAMTMKEADKYLFNYFTSPVNYATWATNVPLQPKVDGFNASTCLSTDRNCRKMLGFTDVMGGIMIKNPGIIPINTSKTIDVRAHNWGPYGKDLSGSNDAGGIIDINWSTGGSSLDIYQQQINWISASPFLTQSQKNTQINYWKRLAYDQYNAYPFRIKSISSNATIENDGSSYSAPAQIKRTKTGPISMVIEFPKTVFVASPVCRDCRTIVVNSKPRDETMTIPSEVPANALCPPAP